MKKNTEKIENKNNNILPENAASVEIKRKRGRPRKTENNNISELKNKKNNKINKKNNSGSIQANNINALTTSENNKNNSENNIIVQDNNQVKKRGRPKGTTGITRKDNIQCCVTDEVKRKILAFNMVLFHLPKITDRNDYTQIQDRTDLFFNLCIQHGITPTLAGYSLSLGIDRHTLYNWLNNKTEYIKNTECFHVIKNAYDFINSSYENLLTEGKIVPVSGFFLLQNNYGYKQQTDHVITANTNDNVTDNDIYNRAALYD